MIKTLDNLNPNQQAAELLKYLFFGGCNAVFAYLVYALGIYMGSNYAVASLMSFIISVFTGYLMYKHLVFRPKKERQDQLVWYYMFYISLYFLQISLHYIFNYFGYTQDYINGLVVQAITIVIAFIVNRFVFFKN